MLFFLLLLAFSYSYAKENYLEKLKKPLVQEKDGYLYIEHFDKIVFKEKTYVLFKDFSSVIVKTQCSMKKGVISRGNFVAICATVGTGFSQGFFQPVLDKIKLVQWLFDRPKGKPDFTISIDFNEKGLNLTFSHERGSQKILIPYEDVIISKVNP